MAISRVFYCYHKEKKGKLNENAKISLVHTLKKFNKDEILRRCMDVMIKEAKLILKESLSRIQSMALIHQSLYEDLENDYVDFDNFLQQFITNNLSKNQQTNIKDLYKLNVKIKELKISNDLEPNDRKIAVLNAINKHKRD